MIATPPQVMISHRYEVLARLGAGAMGTVYRVQDRLTGQVVALKQNASARDFVAIAPRQRV